MPHSGRLLVSCIRIMGRSRRRHHVRDHVLSARPNMDLISPRAMPSRIASPKVKYSNHPCFKSFQNYPSYLAQ
eukprot:762493-Hanusia_phi.AAC.1